MTRTVQARQRGKCIFTTTCSFMREGSGGHKVVEHEWGLPEDAVDALEARLKENEPVEAAGRFAVIRLGIINCAFHITTAEISQIYSNKNVASPPQGLPLIHT